MAHSDRKGPPTNAYDYETGGLSYS